MERVRKSCGFQNGVEVDSEGSKGGLCMAWKENTPISVRSYSRRHIDALVDDQVLGNKWRFTGFYGSPYAQEREESWQTLKSLREDEGQPWLVCGDFNEILYGFEKKGGLPREEQRMEYFRSRSHAFKFEAWWVLEDSFAAEVKNLWASTQGNLLQKLKYLQQGLRQWALETGKAKNRKKKALTEQLSNLLEAERNDDNMAEMIDTKLQLNFEIDKDERYWEQRARVN
ncbi:reverse transcriptase [Gossypium australe]|uniref:Reverse transcriptase n=1 Tax=Gossypium australe TaxID=47621 RepID=A0A5B6W5D8_9ROSI|nr:reverse transcriptase [Gossypium australe]